MSVLVPLTPQQQEWLEQERATWNIKRDRYGLVCLNCERHHSVQRDRDPDFLIEFIAMKYVITEDMERLVIIDGQTGEMIWEKHP